MDLLFERIPPLFMPGARRADNSGMRENLIGIALFRSESDILIQVDPVPGAVHTWRSSSGREVDFMIRGEQKPIMVEVKGDNRTQIANARRSIKHTFDRGLVVTNEKLDLTDSVPAIPAPIFLALLEENPVRLAERSIR